MTRRSPFADEAPGGGMLATLYSPIALGSIGVVGIGIVIAMLACSVAVFTHAFSNPAHVHLSLDRAGSQLSHGADVKINGITVGRVDAITAAPEGRGAILDLAIDRDQLTLIPANVTAQVIPKTLFGEKYVELDLPIEPSAKRLGDGGTIQRNNSSVAIETRTVLNNLEPLLTAVAPAQLDATLTSIATAIQGRGHLLGDTLGAARRYTDGLRPTIPIVLSDVGLLAQVNDSYARATRPLLGALKNLSTNARTLTADPGQLKALLTATGRFADTARAFIDEVGPTDVKLVSVSRPVLELMARYSPELACVVRGVTVARKRLEALFAEGPYLRARMYVHLSRGTYEPGIDTPRNLNLSAYGPNCPLLPHNSSGTVPWPSLPHELDGIRGLTSAGGAAATPSTGNPLAALLMGGPLG